MDCQTYESYKGIIPIDCGHRIVSSADRERLEAGLLQHVLPLHHFPAVGRSELC